MADARLLANALRNYGPQVDAQGFPIDTSRPVVFDQSTFEPHTELSMTVPAKELGLPGNNYYNVPSIYNGQIYNPETQFKEIRQNVQANVANGVQYPNFSDVNTAVEAAKSRSHKLGEIRRDELNEAVQQKRRDFLMQLMNGQ